MIRTRMAALLYAELELHVAAMLYVDAAHMELGLEPTSTDLEISHALLGLSPDELVSSYSTSELIRASAFAIVRIILLAATLMLLRILQLAARRLIDRFGSGWRDLSEAQMMYGLLVAGTLVMMLVWTWAQSSMI